MKGSEIKKLIFLSLVLTTNVLIFCFAFIASLRARHVVETYYITTTTSGSYFTRKSKCEVNFGQQEQVFVVKVCFYMKHINWASRVQFHGPTCTYQGICAYVVHNSVSLEICG